MRRLLSSKFPPRSHRINRVPTSRTCRIESSAHSSHSAKLFHSMDNIAPRRAFSRTANKTASRRVLSSRNSRRTKRTGAHFSSISSVSYPCGCSCSPQRHPISSFEPSSTTRVSHSSSSFDCSSRRILRPPYPLRLYRPRLSPRPPPRAPLPNDFEASRRLQQTLT